MSWLISKALYASLRSLPEPEVASLEENSLGGEPSAPSSGNPIPQAYCAPDKMTDFSRLSQFGMTFAPLTADLGEALLMSFREAFPAKTSPQPEREQESTESARECGAKWRGSFVKFDRDTHSWKTHQCSLLGDLEPFSETWPRWGLMRDGECWQQQMSERRTKETGFGSLPNGEKWSTPTAHNAKEGGFPSEHERNTPTLAAQAGGSLNPMWVEWLMGWPLGWTDLRPSATDKSPSAPQPPGQN